MVLRDSLNDKSLIRMIDSAEIVSFDVFDTLLLRVVNTPETIFSCLGEYFGMKDFEAFRVQKQIEASTKAENELGWPHPTFDQIYEHIKSLESTPYDELGIDWDEVRNTELQMERDALKLNPEIKKVYDYAVSQGKKVIAVSDMYLEDDFLKEVLEDNGYKFAAVYDSANVHKTKWVGDLYEHVLATEKVAGPNLVHIGDNESSDYEIASRYGINAYHYKSSIALEDKTPHNVCVGYGAANIVYKEAPSFWNRFGARVGGPLYLGLMQWFMKELENKQYNKIYFLARDGYNLYHLFKKFTNLPVEYLYTSRRALMLAHITQLDDDALRVLPPFQHGQTIRDALDIIEMTDLYSDCIDKMGYSSLDDPILYDDIATGRFKEIYLYHEEEFLARCAKEREAARKYFEEIGFYDGDSVVFDCGWNGSSQYFMDKFLDATGYMYNNRYLYTGIINTAKSRVQLENKDFKAYLFDYDNNLDIQERVSDSIILLELFFSSPEHSVYNYSDGNVVFDESDSEDKFKAKLLDGIEAFMDVAYDFVSKYNIQVGRDDSIVELLRFIEHPTNEEAIMVGDLPYDDAFAKREGMEIKIASLTREQYDKGILLEMIWIPGFFKRDDLDVGLKKLMCYHNGWKIEDYLADDDSDEKELSEEEKLYREDAKKADYEDNSYTKWYKKHYSVTKPYVKQDYEPLISVVVPVYNVEEYQLRECIDSIVGQTYPNWELFLVDDNSSWEEVRDVLRSYEGNPKINVIYRKENGHISKATNDGIFASSGEFIAFMDCDDYIEARTLAEMVYYLNEHPDTDFVYSDEDKVTEHGRDVYNPFFKPDWSPDTILSVMYTNHLAIYRRQIVCDIGGLRTEYNGAQDYDFTLRFMEKSDNKRVGHVPYVLYHWRARPESIASSMNAKPYAIEAMRKLKEDYIKRNGIDASVEYKEDVGQFLINYETTGNPPVSIIIPSKDNPDILRQCIESIKRYTDYDNYEIIVVDNGSDDRNRACISEFLEDVGASYIYERMDFSFSKMCNIGVEAAKGEYVLLLNDDIEVIGKEWLSRMLGQAMQPHAGAVGAKLLYPNSVAIQHIGIANLPIGPSHMYMRYPDNSVLSFGRNRLIYNWLAVTAACLMVSKYKYTQVGGLNEELTVAYNDVDFCFKLYKAGYYNSVRPDSVLYHHESYSRGNDDISYEKKLRLKTERDILYTEHGDLFGKDPFHNPNYGVDRIDYEVNMVGVGLHNYDMTIVDDIYPREEESGMNFLIDDNIKGDVIMLRGWSFTDDPMKDLKSDRYILLRNIAGQVYKLKVYKLTREDLSLQFNNPNLTEGFRCCIDRKILALSVFDYEIGILQEYDDGTIDYTWSDKKITHDGIEDITYSYYSRSATLSEMEYREDLMNSIDNGSYERLVSTGYGAFTDLIRFHGWAHLNGTSSIDYRVEIGIRTKDSAEDDTVILYDTTRYIRHDVARAIITDNAFLSGFSGEIPYNPKDIVNMYVVLTDMKTNKSFYKEATNIESICGILG